MKKFQISSNTYVTFTYNVDKYIQICAPFEKIARETRSPFDSFIDSQANSFEKLYSVGLQMYDNIVTDVLRTVAMEILMKNGVDWYSVDMLRRGLSDFAEGSNSSLQTFFSYRQDVDKIIEDINYKRGVQRSNRSYWQGGGFGIKGALVGKLKADMMNLGAGAIRSIGDSIVNANDRAIVQKYMDDSMDGAAVSLESALDTLICDTGVYIFSILVQEGKLKPVDFLTGNNLSSKQFAEEKIRARADNIYKWYYDNNCTGHEAIEKLCACISEYPFSSAPYHNIYKIDISTKSYLLKVAEYCGITGMIQATMEVADYTRRSI